MRRVDIPSTNTSLATVLQFVHAVNAHDVDEMCNLMTNDHTFIDSLGNVVRSREQMRDAWRGYFEWFPDYKISVEQTLVDSETVVAFGHAEGTYSVDDRLAEANHWQIPAAWRAKVLNGQLCEWQVYADNTPVVRIMDSAKKS